MTVENKQTKDNLNVFFLLKSNLKATEKVLRLQCVMKTFLLEAQKITCPK